MKILLDPIYTQQPRYCSAAMKCKTLVENVLKQRKDVFFYFLYPDWADEEDMKWFPDSPNVKMIKFPYYKDRMREYMRYPLELDEIEAFNGDYWDYDILFTARTGQVPTTRVVMNSPRNYNMTWVKRVYVFEEMPVMTFKPTVAVSNHDVQDLMTLSGYLAADKTFITIQHEKDNIVRRAKEFFKPSKVQKIRNNVVVTSPSVLDDFQIKTEDKMYRGDRPFCLGFTTRVNNVSARMKDIYEVMEKQWIMNGDDGIRLVISSVSSAYKLQPPEQCEVMKLPREDFWNLLKQDIDVILCLDIEAGFGMSMMEPLMLGVPLIVNRQEWSEALFGRDYPFFVKSVTDAYAMVKVFKDNYDYMYDQFVEWQKKYMIPMFEEGGQYQYNLYRELQNEIYDFENYIKERFSDEFADKKDNSIVKSIVEQIGDRQEFVLFDILQELADNKILRTIQDKLAPKDRERRNIVWATAWNEYRLALQQFYGWEDASVKVGHMKKKSKKVKIKK